MKPGAEEKLISCPKCGGAYSPSLPKCPYCGYIHERGAERKFLNDLEQKRQELDKVDDQAREEYKNVWKSDGKSILRRILIIAAVLIALAAVILILHQCADSGDDGDYVQEMVWQHEHFPELDRLYEEGKTEELLELLYRYGAEGHDMWDWPHYEEVLELERKDKP